MHAKSTVLNVEILITNSYSMTLKSLYIITNFEEIVLTFKQNFSIYWISCLKFFKSKVSKQ